MTADASPTRAAAARRWHATRTVGVLALALFIGCSASDRSLEARRSFAIQFNKQNLASTTNAIQSKWTKNILAALESLDIKAIKNPKLTSAILVGRKNGTYGLFLFWIENYPSVDGAELRFSSRSSPVILQTSDLEMKQIRAQARETIVFGSEYDWEEGSDVWRSLEQVVGPTGLEVRLLHAKSPATDWYPVELYKRGMWVTENTPKQ